MCPISHNPQYLKAHQALFIAVESIILMLDIYLSMPKHSSVITGLIWPNEKKRKPIGLDWLDAGGLDPLWWTNGPCSCRRSQVLCVMTLANWITVRQCFNLPVCLCMCVSAHQHHGVPCLFLAADIWLMTLCCRDIFLLKKGNVEFLVAPYNLRKVHVSAFSSAFLGLPHESHLITDYSFKKSFNYSSTL